MTHLYHERRGEQMSKKIHGMAPSLQVNEPYPKREPMQTENLLMREAVHHSSIESLAYQIYREKGGSALDNWLEAERILKNTHHN
jgi:hypothetical protein